MFFKWTLRWILSPCKKSPRSETNQTQTPAWTVQLRTLWRIADARWISSRLHMWLSHRQSRVPSCLPLSWTSFIMLLFVQSGHNNNLQLLSETNTHMLHTNHNSRRKPGSLFIRINSLAYVLFLPLFLLHISQVWYYNGCSSAADPSCRMQATTGVVILVMRQKVGVVDVMALKAVECGQGIRGGSF